MKKIMLPMKFEMSNEILNENFHKVKLYVCHNGENYNNSNFSDLAIAKASKTLQNIPILAYIKRDEDGKALGFGGHEVEYRLEEKDGEFVFREHYYEVPIGVIPTQNEYSIESIEGRNYVVCSGYIWKCYANEAYDLLLDNLEQSVSMEISVNDGKFLSSGVYDILDYEYLGVTVIGVEPAMENAKIQMSFSSNNDIYEEKIKELDLLLKNFANLKGGESMENEEVKVEEEVVEESATFEVEEPKDEEQEKCPECGKPLDECECEEVIEEESKEENKEEEYSHEEVIGEAVSEEVDERIYTQVDLDLAVERTIAEFSEAMEELEKLREFKAEYDRKIALQELNDKMDTILVNFNVGEDLVKELKEKVVNGEYSLEKFELELYRNNTPMKKEYKKEEKQTKLPIVDSEEKMSEVDKFFLRYNVPKRK